MSPIRRDRIAARVALSALGLTAGCRGPMSFLDPAARQGREIAGLTWFLIGLGGVVYLIVIALMAIAIVRRRRDPTDPDLAPKSSTVVVIAGAVIPAFILMIVFAGNIMGMGRGPEPPDAAEFVVTGHQWWWEIEYHSRDFGARFRTANELHLPTGRPVRLLLLSADVIHSFWVPSLQGKVDLVPGDTNRMRIVATRMGTYRGTCGEFCGAQHAHMGLTVVVETPEAFQGWLEAQRAAARSPSAEDSTGLLGERLVTSNACALCHSIQGTAARGGVGPDLTHIGSRTMLGAGTVPNTVGTMAAWITDAQTLKPGTKMPSFRQFDGQALRAMAEYLESLK
jgi:cytochrome c oxidase subunit 2